MNDKKEIDVKSIVLSARERKLLRSLIKSKDPKVDDTPEAQKLNRLGLITVFGDTGDVIIEDKGLDFMTNLAETNKNRLWYPLAVSVISSFITSIITSVATVLIMIF